MHLYRPTDLLQFLKQEKTKPKKYLSQNFLIDSNIVNKIIAAAKVKSSDLILEIGPGPGVLTQAILQKRGKVIAIEKDPLLAKNLFRLKQQGDVLEIYTEDFLKFPLREILKKKLKGNQKAKVIANLPYSIATPIITKLIKEHQLFSQITIMLQKEMALRCIAKIGDKNYSSFTLFLNFYSFPQLLFEVSPTCFYPSPRVKSALVSLTLKPPPDLEDKEKFHLFVKRAFQQRRKTLPSALKQIYDPQIIKEILYTLYIKTSIRPQNLSMEDFLNIFLLLKKKLSKRDF